MEEEKEPASKSARGAVGKGEEAKSSQEEPARSQEERRGSQEEPAAAKQTPEKRQFAALTHTDRRPPSLPPPGGVT